MPVPGQMYDHMLNPEKGWPSQAALDFSAKISANVLYDLRAGQVCHLNSSGELEPGVVAWQMGLFIFQGAAELDVDNSYNSSNGYWPISPSGKVMCLVAKGPFELWTTEYDTAQTYLRNQPLRAPTGNSAGAENTSGKLTNQSVVAVAGATPASATAVCGIVSKGVSTNAYGKTVLSFWPVWYPGNASES